MIEFKNNFTTPEQSKRMLGLGVPADSADMKWRRIKKNSHGDKPLVKCEWNVALKDQTELVCGFMEYEYIPCWSVGRLMEIYAIARDGDFIEFDTFADGTDFISQLMEKFERRINEMDFSRLNQERKEMYGNN